jgi:ER lumen protein retaining receptor
LLWTFSIYLEAVAILPQLFMVSKTGEAETITSHYLFGLGAYRALYILNWIYRYYAESFIDGIAVVAGIVQTILYADFFYLYITKGQFFHFSTGPFFSKVFEHCTLLTETHLWLTVLKGKEFKLPA